MKTVFKRMNKAAIFRV